MEITFPGTFLLPLGIILFFIGRKYLYYFTIFFIPFTATSLINSASGAPLVASQYFGILLIIKEFINILLTGKIQFPLHKHNHSPFKYMIVYLFVIMLSTFMPLIIDEGFADQPGSLIKLYQNINSPFSLVVFNKAYSIIFGMLLTYLIAMYNSSLSMLYQTIKIYIISILFTCLWGGFQFFSNLSHTIYPDFLFNTMSEGNQMIIGTTIDTSAASYFRISSVTQEPSHFAQIILTILPFILVTIIQRKVIFSFLLDRIFFTIILLVLILSTSSSAILGIIVGFLIFVLIAYINGICKVRNILLISGLVILCFIVLYNFDPTIQDYFQEIVILKKDSGSALERLYSVQIAWEYFLKYPILGCGWGVITSHDLVVCILANSGVVGFIAFFSMVISIFSASMLNIKKLNKTSNGSKKMLFIISNGFLISIATYLVTCAFVEFTWYLSHFYFLLGILIATNINITNNQYSSKILSS